MADHVTLVGRIGKEPELRYTPSGSAVLSFSFATTIRVKGADGKSEKGTRWWTVAVWGKQGEALQQYLKKGTQLQVIGELDEVRTYDGKNGVGVDLKLTARSVEFVGSKPDEQGASDSGSSSAAGPVDDDIPF